MLKLLFLVEGFTDIRFVIGLSQISELTMAVPAASYAESGLKQRIAESGARLEVDEIKGGRLRFQWHSLIYLLRRIRDFDVVLSQEVLRGSLNATIVGRARGVPVVTYMAIEPLAYFNCRRERRQIGPLTALAGRAAIAAMTAINGRLATRTMALGPYLCDIASQHSSRIGNAQYYGVDTTVFKPVEPQEKLDLRRRLELPIDRFLVVLSSRISHEKDPETALKASALARQRGLDLALLNLSGGYQKFLELARSLNLPDREKWVIARPAVNPMSEVAPHFQAADVVALTSLAEGAALSTLEGLACGTPVVASAVGGMAVQLPGYARLVPRRDAEAMARELLWIAEHPKEAREQALQGRDYVLREWERDSAFASLRIALEQIASANNNHHG